MYMRVRDVAGFLIGIALLLIALAFLPDSALQKDAAEYCQMVHDHKWPDFHHVYRRQCNADGTPNLEYINGH